VGVVVGDEAMAIPHNIFWHHEIVNLNTSGEQLTVSYCPLTGSSLAFDRGAVNGQEFGVSGLLYKNNLVMWNRTAEESLWVQMEGEAGCGPGRGTPRRGRSAVGRRERSLVSCVRNSAHLSEPLSRRG